ncbi:DUF2855 family protein [Pacificimonas sp. WHA3]|uniref:DUF2855 family protein n=1 Tax=Pacificimonas pallii TaxID=2827236 RepID=A0ABS6SDK6_9SPHN|nr:DUF2855 family protein [Pacificimonas pallii]MBV7256173.1 DUF2855 family protein [Pacificimonas pallii]
MNEPMQRVFGQRVMIDRADIKSATVGDGGDAPALARGQALFKIDRVALTANNVTYAAAGDMMGYWRFFPMPDGYGGLPVWGYGECIASKASGVTKGERVYGYWPLGEKLIVDVDDVDARGFSDSSEHRQGLSPVYNRYDRAAEQPSSDRENTTALYRPLFTTGWLIAQQMLGASDYGARQVMFSSASSKTAIGAAWSYGTRKEAPPERIGLTSPQNVEFCEGLGIYDRVLAYDQLDRIADDKASAYIDFAGNRALRHAVHERFGPRLGYSMAVGMTHWTDVQSGEEAPPPEAKMFFAPTVMESEQRRLGASGLRSAMASAWAEFVGFAGPHTDVETIGGIANARDAYERVARGDITGATSLIVTL